MKKILTITIPFVFTLMFAWYYCTKDASAGTSDVLSPEQYAAAIAGDQTAELIDVRTPEEYAQGHIDGARLLNVSEEEAFTSAVDSLDAKCTYYIYCRSGRRSQKAASIMIERGLKVVDLQGGYNAWVEYEKK